MLYEVITPVKHPFLERLSQGPMVCDGAMGTLRDIIEAKGATIVGYWPTEGYQFEASKA